MSSLYPSLSEQFRNVGVCPICVTEMGLAPRYSCANGHAVCHRCKPYYFSCPTCQSPLDEIPHEELPPHMPPPPTHYMPHPMPMPMPMPMPTSGEYPPSAPIIDEFLNHERHAWGYPPPTEEVELIVCPYSYLGCWVKVPEYLKSLHESRCQFRPNLEEDLLPTDLRPGPDDLVDCDYRVVGCKIRTQAWRKHVHQQFCVYKNRMELIKISEGIESVSFDDEDGDPEELITCRFEKYGCMVRMPRRRRHTHQLKCNYRRDDDYDEDESNVCVYPTDDYDPDEQVDCRWVDEGCRVRPRRCRSESHEQKCNYRLEECAFKENGCDAMFHPSRKYAHEKSCDFAM